MTVLDQAKQRLLDFQARLAAEGVDQAILTDEGSIAYFAGFWGYLGVEFGRPTFLIVRAHEAPVVITPSMESEMVGAMTWVEDVRGWEDSGERSWAAVLGQAVGDAPAALWVEKSLLPALVRGFFDERYATVPVRDISPIIGAMRMIKSPAEIAVMAMAGEIAGVAVLSRATGRDLHSLRSRLIIRAGRVPFASFRAVVYCS